MPPKTYALLAGRRSSSGGRGNTGTQLQKGDKRESLSSGHHQSGDTEQLLGANVGWDVRSSDTDSLKRAVAILGAPTRHFDALKEGWAPVEAQKPLSRSSSRTRQSRELVPDSGNTEVSQARRSMQPTSACPRVEPSEEPAYWRRSAQAGGQDVEGPTILKRLVHATGTGAGGLLDLGGTGKQPNGCWTTRSFRSRMESSCVLELERRSQTNIAVVAAFLDESSMPHTLFLEHAPAPTMPFQVLAEYRLETKDDKAGCLQHVFQPGANIAVSRYLRIRFVGHKVAPLAGAGTRAHRLQLLKVILADTLESCHPDSALPLTTWSDVTGHSQQGLQLYVGNQQPQQAALPPLTQTQERKSSPGRPGKRGKEQIAPVLGKGTNSGSALEDPAHPQLSQGLRLAPTQPPGRDIRVTIQQGHAVTGAQGNLPAGNGLPGAILDRKARDQLHDRLARLRRLRAESGGAVAQKAVLGMQHTHAGEGSQSGRENASGVAAHASGEPSGRGGGALQAEETMRTPSLSTARPAQTSVSASEISTLKDNAPAADTPATASESADVGLQQQAWRRVGLLVDTRRSAGCFGAQESPIMLTRTSRQGISSQRVSPSARHPDGSVRPRKKEQLLARLRVFAKRHWPFKKRSRSRKSSPVSRKPSPQRQQSPSPSRRSTPTSHLTAWSAGNEVSIEDSPTVLAANRQLPAFQITGFGKNKEEHTAVSQLHQVPIDPATGGQMLHLNAQPVSNSPALIDLSSATKAAAPLNLCDGSEAPGVLRGLAAVGEAAQGDSPVALIDLSSVQKPAAEQAEQAAPKEASTATEEGLESDGRILTAPVAQLQLPAASVQPWAVFGSPESKPLSQFRLERRRSSLTDSQDLQELQAQLEATAKATEELLSKGRWSRLSPHKRIGGTPAAAGLDELAAHLDGAQQSRLANAAAATVENMEGHASSALDSGNLGLVERELSFGAGCWGRRSRGPSRDGSASTSVATSPTDHTHRGFTHVAKHAPARASLDLWAPRAGTIPEETPSHVSQRTDDAAAAEDDAMASVTGSPEQSSSWQTGHLADAASHPGANSGSQGAQRNAKGLLESSIEHSIFTFSGSPDSVAGKPLHAPHAAAMPPDTVVTPERQGLQNEQSNSSWGEIGDEHCWDSLAGGDPSAAALQEVMAGDEGNKPVQDSTPQTSLGFGNSKPARLAVDSSQDSDSLALSPVQQASSRGSVAREPSDIANPLWESWEGKLANLTDLPEVSTAGEQPIIEESETDEGVRCMASGLAQPKPAKHLSPIQEVESPRSYLPGAEGMSESADHWLWEPQPASTKLADAVLKESFQQSEWGNEPSCMIRSPAKSEQFHEDESAESSQSPEFPLAAESPRHGNDCIVLEEPRMCHSPRLQERTSHSSSRAGLRTRQLQDDRLDLPVPASWDASMFGSILSPGPLQQAAPKPSLTPGGAEGTGSAWHESSLPTKKARQLRCSEKVSSSERQGSRAGPLGDALATSKEFGSKVFSDSPLATTALPPAHNSDWATRSLINSWDPELMGSSRPGTNIPRQVVDNQPREGSGKAPEAAVPEPWGALFDSVDVDKSADWPSALAAGQSIPGPLMASLGSLQGFRPTASSSAAPKRRAAEAPMVKASRASFLAAGNSQPTSSDPFEPTNGGQFNQTSSSLASPHDRDTEMLGGKHSPAEAGVAQHRVEAREATEVSAGEGASSQPTDSSLAVEMCEGADAAQKGEAEMRKGSRIRNVAPPVDPEAYHIADPFNSTEMEKMFQVLPAGASGFSLSLAQARAARGGQKGGRARRSQGGSQKAAREARPAVAAPRAGVAHNKSPASIISGSGQDLRRRAVGHQSKESRGATILATEIPAPKQAQSPTLGKARSRREPLWQALNRRSLEESEEGSIALGESPIQRNDILSAAKTEMIDSGVNKGLIRAHRPMRAADTQSTPASRGGGGLVRATPTPDSNKSSPWGFAPLAKGREKAARSALGKSCAPSTGPVFAEWAGTESRNAKRSQQAHSRRPFR